MSVLTELGVWSSGKSTQNAPEVGLRKADEIACREQHGVSIAYAYSTYGPGHRINKLLADNWKVNTVVGGHVACLQPNAFAVFYQRQAEIPLIPCRLGAHQSLPLPDLQVRSPGKSSSLETGTHAKLIVNGCLAATI
jgi:hypothetical protein